MKSYFFSNVSHTTVENANRPRRASHSRWVRAWIGFIVCGLVSPLQAAIPLSERTVLVNLFNNTGGANWTTKTGWLGAPGTECSAPWFGITCNSPVNTHVTGIALGFNNLNGSLNSVDLTQLPFLTSFDVSFNSGLIGQIPPLNGQLQNLDVSSDSMSGGIPSLTGLTNLAVFKASSNMLTGSIPSLGGLTNLQGFYVDNNLLTGTIPPLTGLSSLKYFYVSDNHLAGQIPSCVDLAQLQLFDFKNNRFTGTVPNPPAPHNVNFAAGSSFFCPNTLAPNSNPAINATWDVATPTAHWYTNCDINTIFKNGYEGG